MSFQAELYAIVPQDLSLMDACFRPMDFVSKDFDFPIAPDQARQWLATCAPLLDRLGSRASQELRTQARQLRESAPGWDAGSTQFTINRNVHLFFEMLAVEFLEKGARLQTSVQFTVQYEDTFELFQRLHFDRKPLVPLWGAVHNPDREHCFATAPLTHTPSRRYYIWRSAEEVRAFFEPKGLLFKRQEDPLTPPSPQQIVELKQARGTSFTPDVLLEQAQRSINANRENWAQLVEVLRTAVRFKAAFIAGCRNITDYD
jgi:hypothetical protein